MKKYILGIVMTMVLSVSNVMAHPNGRPDRRPEVVKKEVVIVKEHCKKCDSHKHKKDKKRNVKGRDDVYRYSEKTPARRPSRPTPPPAPARNWRGTPMINVSLVAYR